MKQAFFSFFVIIISMFIIDGCWLFLMHKRFYTPYIGHLFKDSMEIFPAIIFYILFAIALNVLVVLPALKNQIGYLQLLPLAALFGMVTYGTYDLTNQVTLKNWPWIVTLVDITWGSCLTTLLSFISTFITRYFFNLNS